MDYIFCKAAAGAVDKDPGIYLGFLIFKMTAHRGWHAYVDGKEAQNMILAPMMNGVRLTKGVHDVKFVYRAQWWKNYLLVLAILSMIVLFFWDRKKHG